MVFSGPLHPLLQLGRGEVLVARVHRLELAAIHRRHRLGEEPDLPAEHHEVGAEAAWIAGPLSFRKLAIVL